MKNKQVSALSNRLQDSTNGYSNLPIGTVQSELEIKEQALSAVLMTQYEIEFVILTEHKNLQILIDDFEDSDDRKWFHGKGKKALYEYLRKHLKEENTYFNKRPNEMYTKNQRWLDFCDDCIILVSVGNALYQTPIFLLHPDTYKQSIASNKKTWMNGVNGKLPTLIEGIETRALT